VVLDLFQDRDGAVTVGDLSETVAREWTGEESPELSVSGDVHEALVEQILPKLDDENHVDFDSERGLVSPTSDARFATRLLDRLCQ